LQVREEGFDGVLAARLQGGVELRGRKAFEIVGEPPEVESGEQAKVEPRAPGDGGVLLGQAAAERAAHLSPGTDQHEVETGGRAGAGRGWEAGERHRGCSIYRSIKMKRYIYLVH
jgi:hypothetical protein